LVGKPTIYEVQTLTRDSKVERNSEFSSWVWFEGNWSCRRGC